MTAMEYPIHPDVYLDARRPTWAEVERAGLVRGTPFVVWVNLNAVEILGLVAPWVIERPPAAPMPRRGPRIGRTVASPEGSR